MEPLCSLRSINLVIEERLICKDSAMMLAGWLASLTKHPKREGDDHQNQEGGGK
jgi:hypothetical protein